jgi:cobalt/nickel transport system permease protein
VIPGTSKLLFDRWSTDAIDMHTPDGFVDVPIAVAFWLAALAVVGVAAARARRRLTGERIHLLAIVAAGIFAAQMLNWPIPGGTSAHFVGGALAGIVLGPWLGVLAVAVVVVVQAVAFGDGGILALGLNTSAMAVVNVLVGYAAFRVARDRHGTGAAFLAGWAGVVTAALTVAVGVGASAAFGGDLATVVTTMVAGHALLGVVEGAITAVAYRAVVASEPDLVVGRDRGPEPSVDGAGA